MSSTFCTIVTRSHLHFARALRDSIAECGCAPLAVLVVDGDDVTFSQDQERESGHFELFSRDQVCADGAGKQILQNYFPDRLDEFRWCLKPVFMRFLMDRRGFDRVIFIDPDCFFFSDYAFLFDALERANVLLTPHWRCSDPFVDPGHFATNFTDGMFNGGFVAASQGGVPALDWWARACSFKCEKDPAHGYFDDQRYLDFLPARFEGVEPVRHKGCNVAAWNMADCRRSADASGGVLIDSRWPVVFIHFTASTMRAILLGRDPLLQPFLEKYNRTLRRYKPAMDDLAALKVRYLEQQEAQARQAAPGLLSVAEQVTRKLKAALSK